MANIYVRSTDGSDAGAGSTWALSKATITGAAAIDAAGDNIYLSQAHAESTAGAVTIALAGTLASPVKIVGANDAAGPPTATASTSSITTTGANSISISGSAYVRGVIFNAGTGASSANFAQNTAASHRQIYENCQFNLVNTSSGAAITTTGTSASDNETVWQNCFAKFGSTGQRIATGRGVFRWIGGGLTAGTSAPAILIFNAGGSAQSNVLISGVDLSPAAAGLNLFQAGGAGKFLIRNSKLPASWSGSLASGTIGAGVRYELHNCDSADTNYRIWIEDYAGSIKSETTLVKTGGASDGTVPFSLKMTTSANASYPTVPLESCELPAVWNDAVGSAKTVTVDFLRDSATNLTDDDIWLEVQYLGTSGFPLSSFIADAKADILATAADQTTSSATWTTTGMANPNKQKLSVTFAPQEAGYLQAKVVLAKASATVYVDPKLQVT